MSTRSASGPSSTSSSSVSSRGLDVLGRRLRLDDDQAAASPSQASPIAFDPELLVDRLLERGGVGGRGRHRGTGAVGDLVQQLLEPVGEHHHLLLLQRDRDRPASSAACR